MLGNQPYGWKTSQKRTRKPETQFGGVMEMGKYNEERKKKFVELNYYSKFL